MKKYTWFLNVFLVMLFISCDEGSLFDITKGVKDDENTSNSSNSSNSSNNENYTIGDIGPAGGYIFYDKGEYTDGWRYMEAAPESTEWTDKVWGGYGTLVGGTSTDIGSGAANTIAIVAAYGSAEPYDGRTDYAAKLCDDLVVSNGGTDYDDWFLPSKYELDLMYENLCLEGVGGFADVSYWSSSEGDDYFAWYQDLFSGYQDGDDKGFNVRVRAARAF